MTGHENASNTVVEKLSPLTAPFENIALCFSGGGFRAAGYGLGALSYFHELKIGEDRGSPKDNLLNKVSYMASASGGTITTMLYTQFNVNGKSFCDFYKFLYEALEEDKLLTNTLDILNDDKSWDKRPAKRRNIINAFALAYDQMLFKGDTINSLKGKEQNTHLEEVCFNTTEFYRGILFRQNVAVKETGNTKKSTFVFGNFVMDLDHKAAGHLKLGDVLAASSCFPGGFEPIIFPNDFVYDKQFDEQYFLDHLNITLQTAGRDELEFLFGKESDELLMANRDILLKRHNERSTPGTPADDKNNRKLKYKVLSRFGFMDGGITDNMGLDSMMKANQRRNEKFDLMMTNDVGTIFMDPYAVPDESRSLIGRLTINNYIAVMAVIFLAGLMLLVKRAACHHPFLFTFSGTLLIAAGGLFFICLFLISRFLRGASKKESGLNLDKSFGEKTVDRLLQRFRRTPINVFIQMLKARMSSMLTLNTDIFLKRVRQLLYEEFFDMNKGSHRVMGSRIYDLTFTNDINRRLRLSELNPSDGMKKVAEIAYSSGRTLWFERRENDFTHKEACLIACGQFTTCYNLLNYINNLKGPNADGTFDPLYQKRIETLRTQLKADYEAFQKDPFFLYNELGARCGVSNFETMNSAKIPFPENFKGLIPE